MSLEPERMDSFTLNKAAGAVLDGAYSDYGCWELCLT
jgi:hypothetical protein